MRGRDVRELTPLWDAQALQWAKLTPPLRPSGEDLAWSQAAIDDVRPCRAALVLGGTPETASLRWPRDTTVVSADLSPGVLRHVWRPAVAPDVRAVAVRTDWARLPVADGAFDLVLGDGSLNSMPGADAAAVVRSIARVLRAGRVFSLRAYLAPDTPETPDGVWDELVSGGIATFAAFKFRLLMALRSAEGDVRVADAWMYFASRCPEPGGLAALLGWRVDVVRTIEAYRDQPSVYWFPTLAELRAALAPAFDEVDRRWPTYEMGDRCPTLALRRRPSAERSLEIG